MLELAGRFKSEAREPMKTLPEHRAAALAVAVEIGIRAAFLYSERTGHDYDEATEAVGKAIAYATRSA